MKVTARAAVTFPRGSLLGLTDAQAAPRAHALARRGEAWECLVAVQFKAGERLTLAEIPRGMEDLLQKTSGRGKA